MLGRTNFTELSLLRNIEIFWFNDDQNIIRVHIPTIGQLTDDHELNMILQYFLSQDSKEEGEDGYASIIKILNNNSIRSIIVNNLNKVIPGFRVSGIYLMIGDDILTSKDLQFIIHVLKVGLAMKDYTPWPPKSLNKEKTEIDNKFDTFKQRMEAAEERIRKIKQKSRKQKGEYSPLIDYFAAIAYEFKLSLDEIFNLNYYTLVFYYRQVGKLDAYRINSMAFASGNLKKNSKHKYFTNIN